MSLDDFFNLNLDKIFPVVPTSKPEPEVASITGEAELAAAKTMVARVKELSISQISNLLKITKAADLLINSSIPDDYKAALAKLRD